MVDAVPLQSDFGRYIINDGAKTRRRDRREDKRRLACEEAVTKSRLSYHMVKFENSIKVIFQSVPVSPEPEIIVKSLYFYGIFFREIENKITFFFFQFYLSSFKEKRMIFVKSKKNQNLPKNSRFFSIIFLIIFPFFFEKRTIFASKKCRNRKKIHDFFTKIYEKFMNFFT